MEGNNTSRAGQMFLLSAALAILLSLIGFRYDHRALSHAADPELAQALADWHMPDGGIGNDIRVEWDPSGRQGAVALPDIQCELGMPDCTINRSASTTLIIVGLAWYNGLSPEMQRATIDHEVGHALGLAHDDAGASIMHSVVPAALLPSAFDLSKVARLYPAVGGRMIIAGLSYD